jgi:Arc/MetJ-type ribon-helix-helix transcriptional regulator
MDAFDYGAAAELFPGVTRAAQRRSVGYRRFGNAAEAIRFAIEELPPQSLAGAALEVGADRFDSHDIRRLYDSSSYPLAKRRSASDS